MNCGLGVICAPKQNIRKVGEVSGKADDQIMKVLVPREIMKEKKQIYTGSLFRILNLTKL